MNESLVFLAEVSTYTAKSLNVVSLANEHLCKHESDATFTAVIQASHQSRFSDKEDIVRLHFANAFHTVATVNLEVWTFEYLLRHLSHSIDVLLIQIDQECHTLVMLEEFLPWHLLRPLLTSVLDVRVENIEAKLVKVFTFELYKVRLFGGSETNDFQRIILCRNCELSLFIYQDSIDLIDKDHSILRVPQSTLLFSHNELYRAARRITNAFNPCLVLKHLQIVVVYNQEFVLFAFVSH